MSDERVHCDKCGKQVHGAGWQREDLIGFLFCRKFCRDTYVIGEDGESATPLHGESGISGDRAAVAQKGAVDAALPSE